jgi:hypothetical protein
MRLIWSLSGQLYALNVLGVVNAGGVAITQALTNTVGAAIKAQFTSTGHVAAISTIVSLASVGLRDIRTASQPEFIDTGGAVAGTLAGDFLPPQVALCITLRTALAGPRFRGRVYLCGFGEATNTAVGVINTTATSVNFVTGIKTALQASALDLGVIHRPTSAPLAPSAGFITVVNSIVARDAVWDTQRRRAIPGI